MDQRINPPAFAKSRRQGEGSDIKKGLYCDKGLVPVTKICLE